MYVYIPMIAYICLISDTVNNPGYNFGLFINLKVKIIPHTAHTHTHTRMYAHTHTTSYVDYVSN